MAEFIAILGFVNPDGSPGFAQTKKPLTYIENLRTGESKNRWIDQNAELRWACPERTREQAVARRDRLNRISASRAIKEITELSVTSTIVDELLALDSCHEAARARKLIRKNGAYPDERGKRARAGKRRARPPHTSPFYPLSDPVEPTATFNVGRIDVGFRLAIFDFDNALVDSSALAEPRRAENWKQVHQRIGECKPLPCWSGLSPHELPELLDDLGVIVVLVSREPSEYVNAIAEQFGIFSDWVSAPCAFPRSAAYVEAMERFGVEPSETVVFGRGDFEGAARKEILSLGNPWLESSVPSLAPDIAWLDGATLMETNNWQSLRYVGEADQDQVRWHRGSLLPLDVDSYALGRYFPARAERRHRDQLTRGVLRGKTNMSGDPHILSAFRIAVEKLTPHIPIDVVISVPPYQHQKGSDRFKPYREIVEATAGANDDINVWQDPDVEPSSKRRGRREDRFKIADNLNGRTVLLIDDVVTSGATMSDLADAANQAGAQRIVQLAFARTQSFNW